MDTPGSTPGRRPHLGIHFRCCNAYGYIYKNRDNSAYTGRCPKCGKPLKVRISNDGTGTNQRIFQTNG